MQETAGSIINDAFGLLGVKDEESALESSELNLAIRILNRMMHAFTIESINLGFTEISNIADVMTVPDSTIEPIVSNLAMKLAPHFSGEDISPVLFSFAQHGKRKLFQLSVSISESDYPETLPMGAGNSDYYESGDSN